MQEPSLAETLETIIESRLLDVHVSLPGKIKSYNPATQTADVEPMVQRPVPADDGSTVYEDLPTLPNVRVGWPRGGGYSLQWPLVPGDFVLLVFPTFDPSQWRETGSKSKPAFLGLHVLGHPVALPVESLATSPLLPPIGDEAVFEIGGTLRLGGLLAQYVALSTLVDAQLQALKAAFDSWVPVPNDGGAALKTILNALTGSGWPVTTAATKVKAE